MVIRVRNRSCNSRIFDPPRPMMRPSFLASARLCALDHPQIVQGKVVTILRQTFTTGRRRIHRGGSIALHALRLGRVVALRRAFALLFILRVILDRLISHLISLRSNVVFFRLFFFFLFLFSLGSVLLLRRVRRVRRAASAPSPSPCPPWLPPIARRAPPSAPSRPAPGLQLLPQHRHRHLRASRHLARPFTRDSIRSNSRAIRSNSIDSPPLARVSSLARSSSASARASRVFLSSSSPSSRDRESSVVVGRGIERTTRSDAPIVPVAPPREGVGRSARPIYVRSCVP